MGWKWTDYPFIFKHHPDELVDMILSSVRECGGKVLAAAEDLDLNPKQLYNYINRLDAEHNAGVMEKIQEIRDELKKGKARRVNDTSLFGQLVASKPEEAKELMQQTFAEHGQRAVQTADALGISARRFYYYARMFDLFPELQKEVAHRVARDRAARSKLAASRSQRAG